MSSNSCTGTIVITRMKNGDVLTFTLESTGKVSPVQSYIKDTKTVTPQWNTETFPEITPTVVSTSDREVKLGAHSWEVAGQPLTFNGGGVTGKDWQGSWVKDASGKFAMNTATGALRIIGNLASESNTDNDVIRYKGTATVSEHAQEVTATYTARIIQSGENAYNFWIDRSRSTLTESDPETELKAVLYQGSAKVQGAEFTWTYSKGGVMKTAKGETLTVKRDDVDWALLVTCEAKVDGVSVGRDSVTIKDAADEYGMKFTTSAGSSLGSGVEATQITASVFKAKNNDTVTLPAGAQWQWTAYGDWQAEPLDNIGKNNNSPNLTVRTSDFGDHFGDINFSVSVTF